MTGPARAQSGESRVSGDRAVRASRGVYELIGDLDGPVAAVDSSGTVWMAQSKWRVGWAVGAEDRWHVAAAETAVRTRLIDGMPATESAMRVPGGDVVQRVAAARDGSSRGVVLEFVNESSTPVSLALGVFGSIEHAEVSGSQILVDATVALEVGRIPRGVVVTADGDAWPLVKAGPEAGDRIAVSRSGRASAVAVIPLAVKTPFRAVLVVQGEPVKAVSPVDVARGWRSIIDRAATVEAADDLAVNAWRRGIATCVLVAAGEAATPTGDSADRRRRIIRTAEAAVLLDRVGLADEADRSRETLLEMLEAPCAQDAAAAALRALASRRLRAQRTSGLAELAGPLVDAAGAGLDAVTLEQVASALRVEAPKAARDAHRLLAATQAEAASPSRSSVEAADGAVADRFLRGPGTPTATNPVGTRPGAGEYANSGLPLGEASVGAAVAARVNSGLAFGGDGMAALDAVLAWLVSEERDRLVMMPVADMSWSRGSVDARRLLTRHGQMSFSLRWHGPRPAVLWELQRGAHADESGRAFTVGCGLDGLWSSSDLTGEALLDQPSPAAPDASGAGFS